MITSEFYLLILFSELFDIGNTINQSHEPPQCSCPISYNAPFRTEMCTFLFRMMHCRIWDSCIVRFVKLVSSMRSLHWVSEAVWGYLASTQNPIVEIRWCFICPLGIHIPVRLDLTLSSQLELLNCQDQIYISNQDTDVWNCLLVLWNKIQYNFDW